MTTLRSHISKPVNDAAIAHIYNGLHDCSLPKKEWTHAAHLIAAAALLKDIGLLQAECLMPDIIRRYNVATGVENTDHDGYHHTITLSYLRAIDDFMAQRQEPLREKIEQLLAAPLAAPDYLLGLYSKELLFSIPARRGFVPPDLI